MATVSLHNDEPTLNDRLDRLGLVKEVGDAIANCTPPQAFGVHGDWGLGKTSFLQQVQWYLTGDCRQQRKDEVKKVKLDEQLPNGAHKDHISVVWFEAWRYQHEEAPIIALLQEMRSQLGWYHKLVQQAEKIGEVAVRGALLSLEDLTKKIGIQASKIEQAGERWERENLATILPSHTIREHLTSVIDKLLPHKEGGPPPRLVVLIDDLDRCETAAIYRLLEGLKLYLALDNCVFVLGMDRRHIIRAIARMQPNPIDDSELSRQAEDYLEKLCQNVWRLPILHDPGSYLLELLPEVDLKYQVSAAVGEHRCLPPNPRRIKGLANLLQRLADLRPDQRDNRPSDPVLETKILLIVASVYQFHHDLYVRWESDPQFFERMWDWVRGEGVVLDVFNGLSLPYEVVTTDEQEQEAVPRDIMRSRYPDPGQSNIFWVQPLIHEIGDEVGWQHFLPYLRGTSP